MARLLAAAAVLCALGLLLLARRREGAPRWPIEFHPAGDACDTDWLEERRMPHEPRGATLRPVPPWDALRTGAEWRAIERRLGE